MANRRVLRTSLLGIVSGVMLTGCIVAGPPVVAAPPPIPVARVEVVPVRPSPAVVWVPGHWAWHGSDYVWRAGHWATPPAPGHVWVPGHWAPGRDGHVWVEGHWRQ